MNEDLPDVVPMNQRQPVTSLRPEDVRQMLQGLQPGSYLTQDLFPRYVAWAKREGYPVGTRKALGEALRRLVGRRVGKAHGNVSVFELTSELLGQD